MNRIERVVVDECVGQESPVPVVNLIRLAVQRESGNPVVRCRLIGWTVVDLIRSRAALEAEIWTAHSRHVDVGQNENERTVACVGDAIMRRKRGPWIESSRQLAVSVTE
jgi:hypothetical protein